MSREYRCGTSTAESERVHEPVAADPGACRLAGVRTGQTFQRKPTRRAGNDTPPRLQGLPATHHGRHQIAASSFSARRTIPFLLVPKLLFGPPRSGNTVSWPGLYAMP